MANKTIAKIVAHAAKRERLELIAELRNRVCLNYLRGECQHGSCHDLMDLVYQLEAKK
jgi:hypothetical protein